MIDRVKSLAMSVAGNSQMMLILFMIAVLILITLWVYKLIFHLRFKQHMLQIKNIKGKETQGLDLYLFYTEWCPHCKKPFQNGVI